MADKSRRKSSILKVTKTFRAPLQDVDTLDVKSSQEEETHTQLLRRRVSFAGKNFVKEFCAEADIASVHHAPVYEQEWFSTDSSSLGTSDNINSTHSSTAVSESNIVSRNELQTPCYQVFKSVTIQDDNDPCEEILRDSMGTKAHRVFKQPVNTSRKLRYSFGEFNIECESEEPNQTQEFQTAALHTKDIQSSQGFELDSETRRVQVLECQPQDSSSTKRTNSVSVSSLCKKVEIQTVPNSMLEIPSQTLSARLPNTSSQNLMENPSPEFNAANIPKASLTATNQENYYPSNSSAVELTHDVLISHSIHLSQSNVPKNCGDSNVKVSRAVPGIDKGWNRQPAKNVNNFDGLSGVKELCSSKKYFMKDIANEYTCESSTIVPTELGDSSRVLAKTEHISETMEFTRAPLGVIEFDVPAFQDPFLHDHHTTPTKATDDSTLNERAPGRDVIFKKTLHEDLHGNAKIPNNMSRDLQARCDNDALNGREVGLLSSDHLTSAPVTHALSGNNQFGNENSFQEFEENYQHEDVGSHQKTLVMNESMEFTEVMHGNIQIGFRESFVNSEKGQQSEGASSHPKTQLAHTALNLPNDVPKNTGDKPRHNSEKHEAKQHVDIVCLSQDQSVGPMESTKASSANIQVASENSSDEKENILQHEEVSSFSQTQILSTSMEFTEALPGNIQVAIEYSKNEMESITKHAEFSPNPLCQTQVMSTSMEFTTMLPGKIQVASEKSSAEMENIIQRTKVSPVSKTQIMSTSMELTKMTPGIILVASGNSYAEMENIIQHTEVSPVSKTQILSTSADLTKMLSGNIKVASGNNVKGAESMLQHAQVSPVSETNVLCTSTEFKSAPPEKKVTSKENLKKKENVEQCVEIACHFPTEWVCTSGRPVEVLSGNTPVESAGRTEDPQLHADLSLSETQMVCTRKVINEAHLQSHVYYEKGSDTFTGEVNQLRVEHMPQIVITSQELSKCSPSNISAGHYKTICTAQPTEGLKVSSESGIGGKSTASELHMVSNSVLEIPPQTSSARLPNSKSQSLLKNPSLGANSADISKASLTATDQESYRPHCNSTVELIDDVFISHSIHFSQSNVPNKGGDSHVKVSRAVPGIDKSWIHQPAENVNNFDGLSEKNELCSSLMADSANENSCESNSILQDVRPNVLNNLSGPISSNLQTSPPPQTHSKSKEAHFESVPITQPLETLANTFGEENENVKSVSVESSRSKKLSVAPEKACMLLDVSPPFLDFSTANSIEITSNVLETDERMLQTSIKNADISLRLLHNHASIEECGKVDNSSEYMDGNSEQEGGTLKTGLVKHATMPASNDTSKRSTCPHLDLSSGGNDIPLKDRNSGNTNHSITRKSSKRTISEILDTKESSIIESSGQKSTKRFFGNGHYVTAQLTNSYDNTINLSSDSTQHSSILSVQSPSAVLNADVRLEALISETQKSQPHQHWLYSKCDNNLWSFKFKLVELELKVRLKLSTGLNEKIEAYEGSFVVNITELQNPIKQWGLNILKKNLSTDAWNAHMNHTSNLLLMLEKLTEEVAMIKRFMVDIIVLEGVYNISITKTNLSFNISSIKCHLLFQVTFLKLDKWDSYSPNDINIVNIVGETRALEVKNLITCVNKDEYFLRNYLRVLEDYKRTLEGLKIK